MPLFFLFTGEQKTFENERFQPIRHLFYQRKKYSFLPAGYIGSNFAFKTCKMKNTLSLLIFTAVFGACMTSENEIQQELLHEISALEKTLLDVQDASKDKHTAMVLIEKTKQYAKQFPDDTQTPELLFKAADVARGAREYGKAVHLWGQVWRNYETHQKAPMALFLQGFTFDSDLRDAKMATQYYNEFLKKYPDDPLAPQVKQLLSVVEISPEELVKQFEAH